MTAFKTISDLDLAYEILCEDVDIKHPFGTSYERDLKQGLENVLYEYSDVKEYYDYIQMEKDAMAKHIKILEKMLDRRSVKYKTWNEKEGDIL